MKKFRILLTLAAVVFASAQGGYAQDDNSYEALMSKMREYTWQTKEYAKAIEIGETLLERFPNNASVEQFMGNLYFYTEQDSLALVYLEKSLMKEPSNTDVLNSLYHLSFKQKNYEAAERYLDRLMSTDPKNLDYRLRRAQVYTSSGRYDESRSVLDQLTVEYPENESVNYLSDQLTVLQIKPETELKNGIGAMYRQLSYSGGMDSKRLLSARYIRKQGKATIVATGTYGEHYDNKGVLLESELYYNHTADSYSQGFINWSNKKELFAQLNAGYTYFRKVGKGWVPGLGARYTHSDGSDVYTGVADVSKYWGRNLTVVRFYGIFDDSKFYQAYSFTHRYNFTTRNYLQFMYTLGTSPDDKTRLVENNLDFKSHSFSLFGNVALSRRFDARAFFTYTRQKVSPTWKYTIYESGVELIYNF